MYSFTRTWPTLTHSINMYIINKIQCYCHLWRAKTPILPSNGTVNTAVTSWENGGHRFEVVTSPQEYRGRKHVISTSLAHPVLNVDQWPARQLSAVIVHDCSLQISGLSLTCRSPWRCWDGERWWWRCTPGSRSWSSTGWGRPSPGRRRPSPRPARGSSSAAAAPSPDTPAGAGRRCRHTGRVVHEALRPYSRRTR